jgi:hypothetical protein
MKFAVFAEYLELSDFEFFNGIQPGADLGIFGDERAPPP